MKKIIMQCPINSLGYGIVGHSITRALSKIADVTLHPIGNVEPLLYKDLEHLDWRSKPFYKDGPTVKIWHQNGLCDFVGSGLRVGFPIFELDTFSDIEIKSLKHCDKLIVCSQWAKDVIKDNGINVDTCVVPLGVDTSIFHPPFCRKEKDVYTFFTCGKWEYRKGHDILLECFERAFSPSDNVELLMMCHNPFPQVDSKAWERYYRSSKLSSKIKLLGRVETQQEVAEIMRGVDCGLFLSRAEGFNLELLECMACGSDIIYTNYSGHTEFARGRSVNVPNKEVARDGVWFNGTGNWADIDEDAKDQIVAHMKSAYLCGQVTGRYSQHAETYTWEKSANKVLTFLQ
jgi:glycosyltransferase involved in cell wall biosynthesis